MFIILHSLYFFSKFLIKFCRRVKCLNDFRHEKNAGNVCENKDLEYLLKFDPPVYKLRYVAVQELLLLEAASNSIEKIVEFGCAEMNFILYMKHLYGVKDILMVDINEALLEENRFRVQPQTIDYLNRRTTPLTISVFAGSASDPDCNLLGADVVIGIEIIEHLYPDELDALPSNIFGYIKPKLVVLTTPNADFNVVFQNFTGFRHSDHKFEWTREQFEAWALNILERYPTYTVTFTGVGNAPKGREHVGFCSQIAIFRKIPIEETANICEVPEEFRRMHAKSNNSGSCYSDSSYGLCTYLSYSKQINRYENNASMPASERAESMDHCNEASNIYYKLLEKVEYPFEVDERSTEEKVLHEGLYNLHRLGVMNGMFYNEDLDRSEVPLYDIIKNNTGQFTTENEMRKILELAGYCVEACLVHGTETTCVIYEPIMDDRSSTPISDYTDIDEEDQDSNWTSIPDDENWNLEYMNGCPVRPEDINSANKNDRHCKEIIADILNGLQRTVNVEIENNMNHYSEAKSDVGSSPNKAPVEAEGVPANLVETHSTEQRQVLEHKVHRAIIIDENDTQKAPKRKVTEVYANRNWKQDEINKLFFAASTSKTAGVNSVREPIPGTSNVKKKKKPKKFDNEEESFDDIKYLTKTIIYNTLNKVDSDEIDTSEEREMLPPNTAETTVGSNSKEKQPHKAGKATEHVAVLVTSTASNSSVPDSDVTEGVTAELDVNMQESELAHASREALFDPNSQVSILDDFVEEVEAAENAEESNLPDGQNHVHQQHVVLMGVNMNINEDEQLMLPANADPFPNWLLQLLGANAIEAEAESHDEPHFYCQGDGIGVHPSIVEVDMEEELSSSDSSTSEVDEAEPTVSDPDVAQIPEDVAEEGTVENRLEIAGHSIDTVSPTMPGTSSNPDSADEYYDSVDESIEENFAQMMKKS